MSSWDDAKLIAEELKKIAAEYNVTIITARQPAPSGYRAPPEFDGNDIIIIDYIGLLK